MPLSSRLHHVSDPLGSRPSCRFTAETSGKRVCTLTDQLYDQRVINLANRLTGLYVSSKLPGEVLGLELPHSLSVNRGASNCVRFFVAGSRVFYFVLIARIDFDVMSLICMCSRMSQRLSTAVNAQSCFHTSSGASEPIVKIMHQ